MASYAPLFAKNGHHSWNPDLIYFDNERAYHPYSYWVQQMYATTTADTTWPVTVEGPSTLRRTLPDAVRLRIAGNAKADLNNLVITTASGETINLGNVAYDGRTIDTALDLHADSYSIDTTVVYYEGRWGMDLICGDIDGKNHNIVSLGRGHSVRVVRDGTAYALAGTEVSMNEVRPGTTWQVHADITDRGQAMKLYIDGTLIADGTEVKGRAKAHRHRIAQRQGRGNLRARGQCHGRANKRRPTSDSCRVEYFHSIGGIRHGHRPSRRQSVCGTGR